MPKEIIKNNRQTYISVGFGATLLMLAFTVGMRTATLETKIEDHANLPFHVDDSDKFITRKEMDIYFENSKEFRLRIENVLEKIERKLEE